MSQVLRDITKHWLSLIEKAEEVKQREFGDQAAEANEFYQSDSHSFLRGEDSTVGLKVNRQKGESEESGLTFEATANLTANVVSVFLPVLYHKNPNRVARPRMPAISPTLLAAYRQAQVNEMMASLEQQVTQNPALMADPGLQQAAMQLQQQSMMLQQPQEGPSKKEIEDKIRAALIEHYMNYTPNEMNLKGNSRDALIEAIVKGLGLLWLTIDNSGGRAITCLEYDSVDHFLKDPDGERPNDCMWIARRRKRPVWEIERDFALPPGSVKGTDSSSNAESDSLLLDDFDRHYEESTGESADLAIYYELYSRMGIGARLKGFAEGQDEEIVAALEKVGDHCFLAICPSCETPLNLPEEVVDSPDAAQEVLARLEWPIPFHKNRKNPWPCAGVAFRKKSRSAWPMSYVHPALGYQRCINWILSFLMGRIGITSRAFMVMPAGLDQDIYDAVLKGKDLTLLKIKSSHPEAYEKFCTFLKMPEENGNIWTLLQQLKNEYEDATGVNELNLSARNSTQMRSAAEVDLKRDVLSVRPDDMANEVDSWMSEAAKLEAIAARYVLDAADVAPIFGEDAPSEVAMGDGMNVPQMGEMTQLWMELVKTDDIDKIVSEYEYTIESGSTRKPDKTQQVQNIDEGGAMVLQQFLQVWTQTGDPSKFNAFIEQWAKTREMAEWHVLLLPDMQEYMMQQQMMMMQQQAAAAQGGGGEPGGGESPNAPPPEEQQPPPPGVPQ